MAEMKTQANDRDVDAFLDSVEDAKRRADAKAVRELMAEVTGELELAAEHLAAVPDLPAEPLDRRLLHDDTFLSRHTPGRVSVVNTARRGRRPRL